MKEYFRLILGRYDVMNNEDWYKASRYMNNSIIALILVNIVLFIVLVLLKSL